MSTLTKVLIVLLSVASIFLCGTVATYVASADDFRAKYTYANKKLQGADADVRAANDMVRDVKDSTQHEKTALQNEIGSLKIDLVDIRAELQQLQTDYKQRLSDMTQATSALAAFEETSKDWQLMYQNEHTELMKVNAERTTQKTQNKQLATAIRNNMAIITQLEGQLSQLAKEKEDLQAILSQVYQKYGKTVRGAPPNNMRPAPPSIEQFPAPKAAPIRPLIKEMGLKGVITQLDLKNSLAEISIGNADGVKEKMRFYATRGDNFICEILILDVYAERAVGLLERVQSPPKSGDGVSTSVGS